MSIRLSSLQMHQQGINSLLDVQRSANRTQQQIATGKRILTPGDDPIAATRILQLTQELELNALYNNNAGNLQNRLEREDVAISNISNLLQRAQELVIQAGNGAVDAEQRGFISIELDGIVESMVTAMNTRDGNGNFIFAGLQAGEQPFVQGHDGRYVFQGDEGQRTIQLGPGSFVSANDSGKRVFEDIPSQVKSVVAQANPRNRAVPAAEIGGARVLDQTQFDEFYPEDVVIEFRPLSEVEPPTLTYNIKQVSDGRLLHSNVPFQSGETIEFAGAAVQISGVPAPGDTFLVSSSDKKGLLATLQDFSGALKVLGDGAEDRARLSDELAATLTNLDRSQTRLLEVQSSVGARLNLVENVQASNEDLKLATQTSLSELQDLDFAEAVSKLSQETFILEAAQASFARVSGLSIFNFI